MMYECLVHPLLRGSMPVPSHRTRESTKGCSLALVRLCLTVSFSLGCSQHRKCVRPCILGLCSIRLCSLSLSKLFNSLQRAAKIYAVYYLAIIFAVQRLPQPPCLRQKFNKAGERKKDDGEMASSTSHVLQRNQYKYLPYLSFEFNNDGGDSWSIKYQGISPTLHS